MNNESKSTNNQVCQELSTSLYDLDDIITGLHKSSLNVIFGQPAMGKTSLMLNIAVNVAHKEKVPVAIFSLEMSKEQIVSRIICCEAMIEKSKMINGKIEDEDFIKLSEELCMLLDT